MRYISKVYQQHTIASFFIKIYLIVDDAYYFYHLFALPSPSWFKTFVVTID